MPRHGTISVKVSRSGHGVLAYVDAENRTHAPRPCVVTFDNRLRGGSVQDAFNAMEETGQVTVDISTRNKPFFIGPGDRVSIRLSGSSTATFQVVRRGRKIRFPMKIQSYVRRHS